MTEVQKRSLPPVSQWQTQLVRLTAFPTAAAELQELNWWKELIGNHPEVRESRPSKGELRESGPFDEGKLLLQVQPLRVDWHFMKSDEEESDLLIPSIGSFVEVADKFIKLMLAWLGPTTVLPLQRIAFGAVLLQPVESHVLGYEALQKYLHSVKLSVDSTDFVYQINRPRSSHIGSLPDRKLNRLSKWSCAAFQRARYQLGPEGARSVIGQKEYACRLELDINTSQEFKAELPSSVFSALLPELFTLAKEIAEKGDIE